MTRFLWDSGRNRFAPPLRGRRFAPLSYCCPSLARAFTFSALLLALGGCGDDGDDACPRGRGIASIASVDATKVKVTFACRVDSGSAQATGNYSVKDLTVQPEAVLTVHGAAMEGDRAVLLSVDPQEAGATYTLKVDGVKDAAGNAILATGNFTGSGKLETAPVTFRFDDRAKQQAKEVWLLLSINPQTGAFSPGKNRFQLKDDDGDHIFEGTLAVEIDPLRTVTTDDDGQGPEHIAYSARAVDQDDEAISKLAVFEVLEAKAQTVDLEPIGGVKPPPPGGTVVVTFKVDDRPAKALTAPSLSVSFTDKGVFDPTFPTTLTLEDADGDHVWEATAPVQIDAKRVLGGLDPDTLPYSAILVEGGKNLPGRSVEWAVTEDKPLTVDLLVGSADKVAVTFRVDVSAAWLDPTGSKKGIYPGEAVFLTGEFGQAEDAFGQNASDAFAGGENVVLQMVERADFPGVWERTIFLPKNRPYGWKVVRCPKDVGCTKLNKMVLSSGRAFPTVMKNLATELCDAGRSSWTDTNCQSPKVIDPRDLSKVDTGAGVMDYSSATIHQGTGGGLVDQKDPAGTPTATLMFKQESPDLVAVVKEEPIETKVYVVGTWRDVNIPGTPDDIVNGGQVVDLGDTDYDAGFIGGSPPTYELSGTTPPPPVTFTMDGALDSAAKQIGGTAATMKLHMAISGDHLYIATDDAGEGSDHFILISATGSGAARPAPWGKPGTVAFGGKTLFIADENDNDYAGIFELDPDTALADTSTSTKDLGVATPATNGGVLEAVINLKQVFGSVPSKLYIAVGPWGTDKTGTLYGAAAVPVSKDADGNIDANEILEVSLPSLTVTP
jgi:hypothetical protein